MCLFYFKKYRILFEAMHVGIDMQYVTQRVKANPFFVDYCFLHK